MLVASMRCCISLPSSPHQIFLHLSVLIFSIHVQIFSIHVQNIFYVHRVMCKYVPSLEKIAAVGDLLISWVAYESLLSSCTNTASYLSVSNRPFSKWIKIIFKVMVVTYEPSVVLYFTNKGNAIMLGIKMAQ